MTYVANEDNQDYQIPAGGDTEDKIFLLSLSEVRNVDYGFSTDATRVSTNTAYAASGGKIFDINNGMITGNAEGQADYWWLRSPGNAKNRAAAVSVMGVVLDGPLVDSDTYAVRPAFNLDIQSVLFTSAAVGGKVPAASGGAYSGGIFEIEAYNRDDWKTTILDKDRGFAVSNVQISGSTVTFSYSGAETGTNEYISAVIITNGDITHYGRVLELDGTMNGAAGDNVAVSIPAGVTLGAGTELYLFNEQYNGGVDDDTKLTDYASAFVKAEDTAVPSLTAGAVSRTSDTGAEVKFTSSEAGTYYYKVVDSGASMPNIDTTGAGMTCDRSEQTITLNNLTVGAKDIYIVVKDDVGHISQPLKIRIPAYIPPSYGISAAPTELSFGSAAEGYASAPAAQTVTVENTSGQSVTVDLPVSTNYVITAGTGFDAAGTAVLGVSGTAQFTVQPKTGLSAGNYDETLIISGTGGASTGVALSVHVHGTALVSGKAATCTEEGSKEYYTCTVCGKAFEDKECTKEITDLENWKVIGLLPHTWLGDYQKEYADESKHYLVCTVCGTEKPDSAEAHIWNVGSATENEDKYCEICGYVAEARLEHVHVGTLVEGKEPSCTEEGSKEYYTCTVCGKAFEDKDCTEEITDLENWKVIPAEGHTYEYGRCTKCNEIDPNFKPAIIEGADGVWKKGSTETLSFRSDGRYADFLKVQVDGRDVAASNYEVGEGGNTLVTLKASYLETLSVGGHSFAIVFQTGTAETTFTVIKAENGSSGQEQETPSDQSGEASRTDAKASKTGDKVPGTGDDSRAALWGMLALFAGVGSAEIVLVRRRKIR